MQNHPSNIHSMFKIFLVFAISLSLICTFFGSVCRITKAADTNWITVNSVKDLTDNVIVQGNQPLLCGHSYNVTLTVNVPFTHTTSAFEVSLYSQFNQHGSQFWYILSGYGGYDPYTFTAGLRTISFKQVEGNLVLSVSFSVPQDLTKTTEGGLTLRKIINNIDVVSVKIKDGTQVGSYKQNVSDPAIQRYLETYSLKSTYISQGKIDPVYSNLINGILEKSQKIYLMGLPDDALSILNNIDPSNFPAPPNNSLNLILIILVVILGVVTLLVALKLLRSRACLSDASNTASALQKELAALEISAMQYDKILAEKISSIKSRIGELFE
ncbi:MAG: hypothetical protein QXZ70_03740 [Candidatus Bathyarchaeia archaeon]